MTFRKNFIFLLMNLASIALILLTLCSGLWSVGVVYYNITRRSKLWTALYGAFLGVFIYNFFLYNQLPVLFYLLQFFLLIWFIQLDPLKSFCNIRWQKPWSRIPYIKINDAVFQINNVRDFHYRSEEDYDVRYRQLAVDPAQVRSVDLAISYWDGMRSVAHTMLSFGFADGRYLVVSMETRLPEGMSQGFLPGLYKQYGLILVLGTEDDLLKLRSDFRKEELFLYRTNATQEQAELLLRRVLKYAREMQYNPRFYNSVFRNCTTSLAPLLRLINPHIRHDIRLLFNGFSDELLFDLGYLKHREGESFADLKNRRMVSQYLTNQEISDYSAAIRTNL